MHRLPSRALPALLLLSACTAGRGSQELSRSELGELQATVLDSATVFAEEASAPPAEETLQQKILRSHPALQPLQELYEEGGEAYLQGELDLAEEYFLVLKGELEAAREASPDSLSLLYLESVDRKLDGFVDILSEERFFAESYAPADEAIEETWAQLRARYELPDFLLPPVAEPTGLAKLLAEDRPEVQRWVDRFTGGGRAQFETWLERHAALEPVLGRILEEEGLPRELVALAVIESGLQSSVRSRAAAVGYWQFVRSTAKLRGLRVDEWVDERRDVERSTRAAARHLTLMHNMFRDWSLALAAYNAGEYRIQRAIGLQGDADYWTLRLPRETREYVPKFIAAARILADPAAHGFERPAREGLAYDHLELDGAYSLDQVAEATGIPEPELRELNPQLLVEVTPPGGDYRLRVPAGRGDEAAQAAVASIPDEQRISWQRHRLRSGETLGQVARRYGTTASAIMELNGIRDARRVRAGRMLTIPFRGGGGAVVATPSAPRDDYRVQRGDTLIDIARQHGTTVTALRRANGLRSDRIHPGQELSLPAPSAGAREYRVRSGDTLSAIGQRFGVSIRDLARWNGLDPRGVLRPGQTLRVGGNR